MAERSWWSYWLTIVFVLIITIGLLRMLSPKLDFDQMIVFGIGILFGVMLRMTFVAHRALLGREERTD